MAFDAEELKHMAAGAVSSYLNEGKTLNQSIGEMAVQRQLNPDQISRLVETANKVAYVKIMETASDRAGSFPLASVKDVQDHILSTGEAPSMQKAASHIGAARSPLDIVSGIRPDAYLEKQASEANHVYEISTQESEANLHKVASYFRKSFEGLAMEKESIHHALIKVAREIHADELAYAKITAQAVDAQELCKVAEVAVSDKTLNRPFYAQELEKVAEFSRLWTAAKEVVAREEVLEEQLSKFASYGALFMNAARGMNKTATEQPKRPLIGGLIGYLGRGKSIGQKITGAVQAADVIGSASLIDKNPSVWQSLRG